MERYEELSRDGHLLRVQAAFLDVKDIPWSDQGMLNGFHPTNDKAYDVIRDAAKLLNLDLRKMK